MIKRMALIAGIVLMTAMAFAQEFGNEWIQYDQKYFKIKIWADGVYRIPRAALLAAIPELSQTDPRNFQVFGRGAEQFIHVEGEQAGDWDSVAYV